MPVLDTIMRAIASSLQYPVIAILIVLAVVVVLLLGATVAEFFAERRRFSAELPKLVDELELSDETVGVIVYSGLLKRQKALLVELCRHSDLCDESREALAANLIDIEQSYYDRRSKVSDFIAKVAPMLGLMGTLIPLGPGLIALGQGDTQTLSESLLMAFDTTILGLAIAAIALLVSTIRKHWYRRYMSALESCAEVVLTRASDHHVFAFPKGLSPEPERSVSGAPRASKRGSATASKDASIAKGILASQEAFAPSALTGAAEKPATAQPVFAQPSQTAFAASREASASGFSQVGQLGYAAQMPQAQIGAANPAPAQSFGYPAQATSTSPISAAQPFERSAIQPDFTAPANLGNTAPAAFASPGAAMPNSFASPGAAMPTQPGAHDAAASVQPGAHDAAAPAPSSASASALDQNTFGRR